jgi:hypothetical protein
MTVEGKYAGEDEEQEAEHICRRQTDRQIYRRRSLRGGTFEEEDGGILPQRNTDDDLQWMTSQFNCCLLQNTTWSQNYPKELTRLN